MCFISLKIDEMNSDANQKELPGKNQLKEKEFDFFSEI